MGGTIKSLSGKYDEVFCKLVFTHDQSVDLTFLKRHSDTQRPWEQCTLEL